MSTFVSIDAEKPLASDRLGLTPILEETHHQAASRVASRRDEQIQTLVEQLFFRPEAGSVRYVGFTGVDASTETTQLCLDVARVLAEEGKYDVGLIDANPGAATLPTQLEVAATSRTEAPWPDRPRLWLVPRQNWLALSEVQRIPEQSFTRLRELGAEFDFAVLCCPPVSWLTTRIGYACDGLVLVLTANKTRRMVAAHMKELLRQAHVPILGTVLAERRLPIPEGLYRQL